MLDSFHAVLLEGVFGITCGGNHDDALVCTTAQGTRVVADVLRPLLGSRVRFAAHHLPLWPDAKQWGGGSCLWEDNGGCCPAGHRERPNWLFNVSLEGILVEDSLGTDWEVESFDGSRTALLLRKMLQGHGGRILAASVFSVEQMRDKVAAAGLTGLVDAFTGFDDLLSKVKPGGCS